MINNLLDYEDMTTLIEEDADNIKEAVPRGRKGAGADITLDEFKNAARLLFSPEPTNYQIGVSALNSVGYSITDIICIIDKFIRYRIINHSKAIIYNMIKCGINPTVNLGKSLKFESIIKISDKIEAMDLSKSAFYPHLIDYTDNLYIHMEWSVNISSNSNYTYNHSAALWTNGDESIKYGQGAYVQYSDLNDFLTTHNISL